MNVKEYYVSINGNYEAAVAIMMNDSFIERMLVKFFNNNSYNDIITFYENKDFKSLFASVHSFKGVVGNLAMTSLYDIASVITEKTRKCEDVDIDEEINKLKEEYNLVKENFFKYAN